MVAAARNDRQILRKAKPRADLIGLRGGSMGGTGRDETIRTGTRVQEKASTKGGWDDPGRGALREVDERWQSLRGWRRGTVSSRGAGI